MTTHSCILAWRIPCNQKVAVLTLSLSPTDSQLRAWHMGIASPYQPRRPMAPRHRPPGPPPFSCSPSPRPRCSQTWACLLQNCPAGLSQVYSPKGPTEHIRVRNQPGNPSKGPQGRGTRGDAWLRGVPTQGGSRADQRNSGWLEGLASGRGSRVTPEQRPVLAPA